MDIKNNIDYFFSMEANLMKMKKSLLHLGEDATGLRKEDEEEKKKKEKKKRGGGGGEREKERKSNDWTRINVAKEDAVATSSGNLSRRKDIWCYVWWITSVKSIYFNCNLVHIISNYHFIISKYLLMAY